jgi:hypothetical protein
MLESMYGCSFKYLAYALKSSAFDTLAALVCPACSEFDARPVDSEVQTQPLLQEPRTVTAHYAAGEAEEGDGKVRSSSSSSSSTCPHKQCFMHLLLCMLARLSVI